MLNKKVLELPTTKYFVMDSFLSTDELETINSEINTLKPDFNPAGIGKDKTLHRETRRDLIYWIGDGVLSDAQKILYSKMGNLIRLLNENLYLGIWSHEFHYSIYPEGCFYKKHVDCFKNSSSRVVSVILYLNEIWEEKNGGELVLHLDREEKVLPLGGRLVCFLSEDLHHEVLSCAKERRSFTGWLKRRDL